MARELNPHFFDENYDLKKQVRSKLLRIAKEAVKDAKILNPMLIDDVVLTGSMANYTWNKASDLDLHIIFDFKRIDKNTELVKSYFDAFKYKWNNTHDIKLFGHEVEIYFQDSREPHNSSGIYSIYRDKWDKMPSMRKETPDMDAVRKKTKELIYIIKELKAEYLQLEAEDQYEAFYDRVNKFKKKLVNYRNEGLTKNKEYSVENLVFKKLRKRGWLKLLFKLINKSYDGIFSESTDNFKLLYERIQYIKQKRHHKRNLIGTTAKRQSAVAKIHQADSRKCFKIEDLKKKKSGIRILNDKDMILVKAQYNIGDISPENPRKLGSTGIEVKYQPGWQCYYAEKKAPIVAPLQSKRI